MRLRDIARLKKLAETKNFTEAAKLCFVSQPVISLSIQRLEEETGMILVYRKKFKNQLQITPAGEYLIEFFDRVNLELSTFQHKLELKNSNSLLNVGLNNPELKNLLRNLFINNLNSDRISEKNINVITNEEPILYEYLKSKKIDFKFSLITNPRALACDNTYTESFHKFIKKLNFTLVQSKINFKKINSYQDLNDSVIITVGKNTFYTKCLFEFLETNNITPQKIMYIETLELAQLLIEQAFGIGIFLEFTFKNTESLEITILENFSYLFLSYLKNNPLIGNVDAKKLLKSLNFTLC
ncbi:MAG: LysR family transcriptional regulator [Sarcina sp.]